MFTLKIPGGLKSIGEQFWSSGFSLVFIILIKIIKGSLEEILPSYEKLRSVCAHVRDAKRSRLTVGRVGTLGAAHVRRMCGACAAAAPVEIEA